MPLANVVKSVMPVIIELAKVVLPILGVAATVLFKALDVAFKGIGGAFEVLGNVFDTVAGFIKDAIRGSGGIRQRCLECLCLCLERYRDQRSVSRHSIRGHGRRLQHRSA